jgi:hypothetical protein
MSKTRDNPATIRRLTQGRFGAPLSQLFQKWGSKVQFKVNDREYFLAFVEDEKKWFVFSPSQDGMQRLPVYVDSVKWERSGGLEKSAGNVQ